MCGGSINVAERVPVAQCPYCKETQTFSMIDDKKRASLFNRANDLRLAGEFDKAADIYEKIIDEDNNDSEAHWGLFLSKYGVEYVKDTITSTYKPTLHRLSSVSVFDDVDYQSTIKYASPISAMKYKKDAEIIEVVMKELLMISACQESYDIFLSYKELDDTTKQRTNDSYLAHDLYNELTAKGYKVFFAPKSLGAGLYEPKIYAAIISSKVMIVLGTKPEYFNAVWVKNEWTRFIELIENGEAKTIIPVYKNMKANELPNRLSNHQAYDMSSMSFLPSLLESIFHIIEIEYKSKIKFEKDTKAEDVFIERGFIALEDKQYSQAKTFFENALNLNPHSSQAYFGELMVEMQVSNPKQILTSQKYLCEYNSFNKAVRFADQQLKTTLLNYERSVKNSLNKQNYNLVRRLLSDAKDENNFPRIISELEKLEDYNNSSKCAKELFAKFQTIQSKRGEVDDCVNSIKELEKEIDQSTDAPLLFVILGVIAGIGVTLFATFSNSDSAWSIIGSIIGGGIIFVLPGLGIGFLLDISIGRLIFNAQKKSKNNKIRCEINSVHQRISDIENQIAENIEQCKTICDNGES